MLVGFEEIENAFEHTEPTYELLDNLHAIQHRMMTEGVCREDVAEVDRLLPGFAEQVNARRFTTLPSTTGRQVAMEAIDWKNLGIAAGVATAVLLAIRAVIKWLGNLLSSNRGVGGASLKTSKTKEEIIAEREGEFTEDDYYTIEEFERAIDPSLKRRDLRKLLTIIAKKTATVKRIKPCQELVDLFDKLAKNDIDSKIGYVEGQAAITDYFKMMAMPSLGMADGRYRLIMRKLLLDEHSSLDGILVTIPVRSSAAYRELTKRKLDCDLSDVVKYLDFVLENEVTMFNNLTSIVKRYMDANYEKALEGVLTKSLQQGEYYPWFPNQQMVYDLIELMRDELHDTTRRALRDGKSNVIGPTPDMLPLQHMKELNKFIAPEVSPKTRRKIDVINRWHQQRFSLWWATHEEGETPQWTTFSTKVGQSLIVDVSNPEWRKDALKYKEEVLDKFVNDDINKINEKINRAAKGFAEFMGPKGKYDQRLIGANLQVLPGTMSYPKGVSLGDKPMRPEFSSIQRCVDRALEHSRGVLASVARIAAAAKLQSTAISHIYDLYE